MKKFDKLKAEIIETASKHTSDSCAAFRRCKATTNEEELLSVIKDNLKWCINQKVISHDYFARFTQKLYMESGIANSGAENSGFSNSGDWNSGYRNSGYRNSGDSNSGYRNSGYRNSGDRNSGYRNSGDRNSGNWNSGNWNSGDRNSGDRNSGDSNSGYSNSGNWNSGDRNSGDSNSGYRNSGAFCTDLNPKMIIFNKPCKTMTVKEWEKSKACELMWSVDPNIWIPNNMMNEEEKKAHSHWETTEGYLKKIPLNDAWANAWNNWTDESKKVFTDLENFDAHIFFDITGIDLRK